MTQPNGPAAPVSNWRRGGWRLVLARLTPRWFAGPLPTSHELVRAPTAPAHEVTSDSLDESLAVAGQATTGRPRPLRQAAVRFAAWLVSAVGVALAFRVFYDGPMLPRTVYAGGAPVWLAAAALVQLARRSSPVPNDSTFRPTIPRVLFWIGLLWAALAVF